MLHEPNNTHNAEDCYALKNLVKGTKNEKKDPGQTKIQKVWGNEHANDLHRKTRSVWKELRSWSQSRAHRKLHNFENMFLDDLQPKDGKIESDKLKKAQVSAVKVYINLKSTFIRL